MRVYVLGSIYSENMSLLMSPLSSALVAWANSVNRLEERKLDEKMERGDESLGIGVK